MGAESTSGDGGERSAARVRLVALVILLVGGAALTAVAIVARGSDEPENAPLRVELVPGSTGLELIVYVPARHNRPEVADNRRSVRVECADAAGAVVAQGRHRWPFTDTDGGVTEAHVHQPLPAQAVDAVERCRVADTEPALQGPVTGAAPR